VGGLGGVVGWDSEEKRFKCNFQNMRLGKFLGCVRIGGRGEKYSVYDCKELHSTGVGDGREVKWFKLKYRVVHEGVRRLVEVS